MVSWYQHNTLKPTRVSNHHYHGNIKKFYYWIFFSGYLWCLSDTSSFITWCLCQTLVWMKCYCVHIIRQVSYCIANERRHYIVTLSLNGEAPIQNDPCADISSGKIDFFLQEICGCLTPMFSTEYMFLEINSAPKGVNTISYTTLDYVALITITRAAQNWNRPGD